MNKKPIQYKVIICEDNLFYYQRLEAAISRINFNNSEYNLSVIRAESPSAFRDMVQDSVDIVILDVCITNENESLFSYTDKFRYDARLVNYGYDLYNELFDKNGEPLWPEAMVFVLSNLPIQESRNAFHYAEAEYFCKGNTQPHEIANHIKNFFDTKRKRIFNNTFVVYGHNKQMRSDVTQFLSNYGIKQLDLTREIPGGMWTILEAVNECANKAESAIVLLSADDRIYNDISEFQYYQPRPNVLFELGLFAGVLGRDRVIVLYEESHDFEFPSDIKGIYYIKYNDSRSWKTELKDTLISIGYKGIGRS